MKHAIAAGEWRSFIKSMVNQSVTVILERETLQAQLQASRAEQVKQMKAGKQQVQELQDNADYQAEQLIDLQNQVGVHP